ASRGRRDLARADAARVGDARPRTHPPGGGAGAGAQAPGGRGTAGEILRVETMNLRRIVFAAMFAGGLSAQTFIQMSDPQFGMYTKDKEFDHETANFEFAVATANRLKPAFVVITGDLVNKAGDEPQIAEFHRIAKKFDPSIKLYVMPGNHDVGNEPTPESLAKYRERFGPDYFAFRSGDIAGIVLNSSLYKAPGKVLDEAAKMEAWFKAELEKAKQSGARHILV